MAMRCAINFPRYFVACSCAWFVIFVAEWVIHGVLLQSWYVESKELWRTQTEMVSFFPWLVIAQIWFAFAFGYVFTKGYENRGLMEGLRYGLLIGLLFGPGSLMMYAVSPIPLKLAAAWIAAGFVEGALAGMVLAAIYRSGEPHQSSPAS